VTQADDRWARIGGTCLVAAALLFWLAWLLMPGVGVTDAHEIFRLVGAHRGRVLLSVVVQLASAVLYVPAVVGIASDARLGAARGMRRSVALLGIGALGSSADAMLHLLAYAMTKPGLDAAALAPVMRFMQGPGLRLLAPLLLAFFAGGAWLSAAAARDGLVSQANPRLHLAAVATAILGAVLAKLDWVSARIIGLAVLGIVAAAQVGVGVGLLRAK
jgi:hypothetical protein